MAITVKLGNRPKNFKKVVTFKMHDGTDGSIECIFKYRTRSEFGSFIDSMIKEVSDAAAPEQSKQSEPVVVKNFSMLELMQDAAAQNVSYLMQALEGWNLSETAFNRENVAQLVDEMPAAAMAIMDAYQSACSQGRLGN